MKKKVLKFGGTSVGSIQRILHAAKIIKKEHDNGAKIIVVVSAMAGTTNNLIEHSKSISKKFNKRDLDVLLTSGEQVTSALISGALNDLGVKAKTWMNWLIPIITEGDHTNSRIINIEPPKIRVIMNSPKENFIKEVLKNSSFQKRFSKEILMTINNTDEIKTNQKIKTVY